MMTAILLAWGLSAAAGLLYIYLYVGARGKNLPPGPPTLPILGNIHQIPKKGAHFQFTAWAAQYGGIYTLKLGTGTAVVLTSRKLIKDLIDKKSGIYSERPASYVAKLIAGGDHILLMDYGAQWRGVRKLVHQHFMESVVEKEHVIVQEAEARQMLRDYLLNPDDHMLHPKRYSNSITMSTVWGVRTPTPRTEHMQRLYSLMEVWSKVMETGATPPVDIYPLLHWLPQGIFLRWRDRAEHVRREMNGLYSDFLKGIRHRREQGTMRGCFMDRVLDHQEKAKEYSDHNLYFMGGTMTEGGSDTSSSIIIAFVHAMTAFPEVQKKAQAELDAVIPATRSPQWSDYDKLPYVAATVKEAMRWRPVTPLAFPHALAEDDWCDGKFLPKGTVVIINAWGLQHDPEHFPNPEIFDPDHFKGMTALAPVLYNSADPEDRDHYGYGSGRRTCPGIHLAERNLWLAMAKLLWAFKISPGKDESGRTVTPDVDPATGYCEGFLVCAYDFPAEFEVRGEERGEAILREFGEAERDVFPRFAGSYKE